MSKIRELLHDLTELNRDELELLLNEATRLFKGMRKIRIKRLFKRCGKAGCTCAQGELTDYGHGPYLYAIWSENGKRTQRSIGRVYYEWEFERMAKAALPVWYSKPFRVSDKEYDALSTQGRWSCKEWSLTDVEFLALYNISPSEDKVGRPRKLRFNKDKFYAEFSKVEDTHTVGESEFRHYGIGTLRGVLLLREMLTRGFYLETSTDGEFGD